MRVNFKSVLAILFAIILISSCTKTDEQKIVGIWQNDTDWFDIHADKTYNTGTGPMTSYTGLKYVIDAKQKQITFYTNQTGQSYYMNYQFVHQDSIRLQNSLPNSLPIIFYRAKAIPEKFF